MTALKIMSIISKASLGTLAIVAAVRIPSCLEDKEIEKAASMMQPQKPMDFSKPNLPVVDENTITYRNVDGDVVCITNKGKSFEALYKTINKYSTKENPNITDADGFYCEIEKHNMHNGRYRDIATGPSILLKNLYDIFTAPDSEEGKTITVKEYTHMMDAWSSVTD